MRPRLRTSITRRCSTSWLSSSKPEALRRQPHLPSPVERVGDEHAFLVGRLAEDAVRTGEHVCADQRRGGQVHGVVAPQGVTRCQVTGGPDEVGVYLNDANLTEQLVEEWVGVGQLVVSEPSLAVRRGENPAMPRNTATIAA